MNTLFRIPILICLLALTTACPAAALANDTIECESLSSVQEEICPIGCPCPESWAGGALEPACTPPAIESCEVTCCFNSGFYLGAQVGYLNPNHKYNVSLNGITTGTFQKTKRQNTVLGGIVLGGRYFIHSPWFLGAEISANMDGSATRFEVRGTFGERYLHKLKRQYSIVPSVIVGTTFAQAFAVYAKLGADISRYYSTLSNIAGQFSSGFKQHKTRTVFLPSVGLEYCFSPTVSTRLEVSHNFQAAKVDMDVRTLLGARDNTKVKVHNTAVTAGFLFKF